jgi:predicted permease
MVIQRVRYSLLFLAKRRSLFLGAVSTIAVVVALTGSALRLPWNVLYSRLPYTEPERLVNLWQQPRTATVPVRGLIAPAVLLDLVARQRTFSDVAAAELWDANPTAWVDLLGRRPRRLKGALVTPNLFDVLGVSTVYGHGFDGLEQGHTDRAIISYDLWQREFNGDPSVLGQSIRLAFGRRRVPGNFVVTGILPENVTLTYPVGTDIYLPVHWESITRLPEDAVTYQVIARLTSTVALADAVSHMHAVADAAPATLSWFAKEETIHVEPMIDYIVGSSRGPLLVIGAVGIALLGVGCLTTVRAMMLLTDASRHERAIEWALGANRWPSVVQSLVHVTVIVMTGSLAGIIGTFPILNLLRTLLVDTLPRAGQLVGIDWTLIGTIIASLALASAFGCVVGIYSDPRALYTSLRATSLGDVPRTRRRVRALIGFHISFLYVLVVFAALTVMSLQRLNNVTLGFSSRNIYVSEVRLLGPKYLGKGSSAISEFRRRVLQRLREAPGIMSATTASALASKGVDWLWVVQDMESSRRLAVNGRQVDAAFFHMLDIQVRAGRLFNDADVSGDKVAVVSESLAATLGTGRPVLGRQVVGRQKYTIVGVVADVRFGNPATANTQALYVPVEQTESETICFALQSTLPREALEAIVQDAAAAADPEQPIEAPVRLDALVRRVYAESEAMRLIAVTFAVAAAVLGVVAVHGGVAQRVLERRGELGLRVALGASSSRLQWLVIRSELPAPLIGILIGVVGSVVLMSVTKPPLFQVDPADPLAYTAIALLLLAMCLVTVLLKSRALDRIDLVSTLRR